MSERAPSGLALYAFGGFRIMRDGVVLDDCIPLKAKALLLYVCRHGQPQPREKLASVFWSDFAANRIAHNQRMALMPVREYLAAHVDISRTDIGVRAWVDVNVFEQTLETLRSILNDDQPFTPQAMDCLADALALYRGDFLASIHLADASIFDEWLTVEREAFRQQFIHAAASLLNAYIESKRTVDGIDLALRILAVDPLHEETHRRLMLLYATHGDRTSALQQFERCQNSLWDELGVEPEEDTILLYERIAASEIEIDTKGSAAPSAPPRPSFSNLPGEMSLFIGRTENIKTVVDLITTVRCVTLIGPGGIGKTRLALQAARQKLDAFPDGVVWVELAPLVNATRVLDAIQKALNLPDSGVGTTRDLLVAFLRDKRLLLVLDNFEHVLDAAEDVYDLLQNSPHIHVLVSSREALQLYGEHVYDVPVLPIDDASALFLERAHAVNPTFRADDSSMVKTLCARLDYLPLAVELAASQSRRQTLKNILTHLEVARLATNLRGINERQRTLFNTMEWSYELLTSEEQILYRRLAYFVGQWTTEAAFAVCGPVAQHLDVLVERSLLRRIIDGEEIRYSMLEVIRQHAHTKLTLYVEEQQIVDRYIAYFVELVERASMGLRGWEFAYWFNVLDENLPNFHAAIEHAVIQEEIESEARLIGALGLFWHNVARPREARLFAERALRHREFLAPNLLAGVLTALAHALRMGTEYHVARTYYQEAYGLYNLCDDRWSEGLLSLCINSYNSNVQASLELLQQARDRIQDLNEVFLYTALSTQISIAYVCLGDPYKAEQAAREGLTRANGVLGDVGRSLRHALGIAVREQGRLEEALSLFQDHGDLGKEARSLFTGQMLFDECQTYLLLDRITDAEECFQRAMTLDMYHVTIEFIRRLNSLGGIAAYSAENLQESCRRYRLAFQFAADSLNELFGFNTFIIALAGLVWQVAAEGYLPEAAHLRDLLFKILAEQSIHLGYTQRFYLNRAAPLLVDYPPVPLEVGTPHDLFAYAQICLSMLEAH